MRRVVSVWLPTLPTDRLRRNGAIPTLSERRLGSQPDRASIDQSSPSVTTELINRRRVVTSADFAAREAGIVLGDPLSRARAKLPTLVAYPADPTRDILALRRLAQWMRRYTPLVTADPPDGLWLDTTGCDHLHGGERVLLTDLMNRLGGAGYASRVAVADTPGCAHAVARHGPDPLTVVETGRHALQQAIMDLPVEALRLYEDLQHSSRQLGLDTIGDVLDRSERYYRAGRNPIAQRVGAALFERLDQALGRAAEPLAPEPFESCPTFSLSFAEPLSTFESLAAGLGVLVGRACDDLTRCESGALRIDVIFESIDQSAQAIRVELSRPSRAKTHLTRMLVENLTQVEAERGVEAMRLVVAVSDALISTQSDMGLDEPLPAALTELTDRLAARSVPVWRARIDPHRPTTSCVRMQASTQDADSTLASFRCVFPPRPSRLFDPPQPIAAIALLPHYPPTQFMWRNQRHRVVHADGPERLYQSRRMPGAGRSMNYMPIGDGNWIVRDYFTVENEIGQRFWLMRESDGADFRAGRATWFVQGVF